MAQRTDYRTVEIGTMDRGKEDPSFHTKTFYSLMAQPHPTKEEDPHRATDKAPHQLSGQTI